MSYWRPVLAQTTTIRLTSTRIKIRMKTKTLLWTYQPSSKNSEILTRFSSQSLPSSTHKGRFPPFPWVQPYGDHGGRSNPNQNSSGIWRDAAAPYPTTHSMFTPGRSPRLPKLASTAPPWIREQCCPPSKWKQPPLRLPHGHQLQALRRLLGLGAPKSCHTPGWRC